MKSDLIRNPKFISDEICAQWGELVDIDRLVPELSSQLLSWWTGGTIMFSFNVNATIILWQCVSTSQNVLAVMIIVIGLFWQKVWWWWKKFCKKGVVTDSSVGEKKFVTKVGTGLVQWQWSVVINHQQCTLLNHNYW